VESAEIAAAVAVDRLVSERLSIADVKLTGLNQPTVKRLRKFRGCFAAATSPEPADAVG